MICGVSGAYFVYSDANWNVLGLTTPGARLAEEYNYPPYARLIAKRHTAFGDSRYCRAPSSVSFTVCLLIGRAIAGGVYTWPWESAIDRAHRLCGQCGLVADEIDRLIENLRRSTLAPGQNLEFFYATFEDRSQAGPCEPCAEAVLDAAER